MWFDTMMKETLVSFGVWCSAFFQIRVSTLLGALILNQGKHYIWYYAFRSSNIPLIRASSPSERTSGNEFNITNWIMAFVYDAKICLVLLHTIALTQVPNNIWVAYDILPSLQLSYSLQGIPDIIHVTGTGDGILWDISDKRSWKLRRIL